jgi:2-polyprenyl-3-methyl-5-hydroxy-6-metoxy-1,4-benzoquinol methylase
VVRGSTTELLPGRAWMNELDVEARARMSAGGSSQAIQDAVATAIRARIAHAHTLLDVGCGQGGLRDRVASLCDDYVGADAIRHAGFPSNAKFVQANLDAGSVSLPDGSCDVVACIETIEHVENPRSLMRELTRLTRPGGLLVVTTPNQLSLLSKVGLLLKNEFIHFQDRPGLYPAHISALLEIDLVRMCRENGLEAIEVGYTGQGRIPLTSWDWPAPLRARSGTRGRAFSDNVLVIAQKLN